MHGVLLDPYTGQARGPVVPPILSERGVPLTHEENFRRGWRGGDLSSGKPDLDMLPDHIVELLLKSGGLIGPFAGARPPTADKSLYEVCRYWIIAGTTITTAAEAIMVPAFNFYNSEMSQGAVLKYTLVGSLSQAVTTPGTMIYRMRWGGVAGALQATSRTMAPTGTQVVTTVSFILTYWMSVRSVGAAATLWCQGKWDCPGTLETTPASTTIMVTHLKDQQIPFTAAAIGAAFDSTAALGPSPTYQPSLGTATLVTNLAFLELLN